MKQTTHILSGKVNYRNQNGFPPTICIQLLNWCNLSCENCRSNSSPYQKDKLEFEKLKSLLVSLKEFGVWRISLTGGEPFYWAEIKKLLVLLSDLEFPFSITTNGFASKKVFDKIDPFVWETGTLYVSIDGSRYIHDKFRGALSYENAVEFMKHVRPTVKKLFVNTVLYTSPKDWAEDLYAVLDNIGIDNWTIISPVMQGRWKFDMVSPTIYSEEYKFIQDLAKGLTTTSFLDFAESDSKYSDIVFIDSDGSIRLPGYFDESLKFIKPLSYKTHIEDNDAVRTIVKSVNDFIISEKYIL